MRNVPISPATPRDARAIAALRTDVADGMTRQFGHGHWSACPSKAEVVRQLRASQVFVARRDAEILGTVRNATYVKPRMSYDLTSRLRLDAAGIISFANKLVSTPGNSGLWGVELDGGLAYHNDRERFSAGIKYGVLFPLGALDHPRNEQLFEADDQGDAGTSQIIKMNLMLKF